MVAPTPGSPLAKWLQDASGAPFTGHEDVPTTPVAPRPITGSSEALVPFMTAGLVAGFEGFSAKVYPDPATKNDPDPSKRGKPWTQGYGSTHDEDGKPFTPNSPVMSKDRALRLLQRDMLEVGQMVAKLNQNLSDPCKAACISLGYNVEAALMPKTSALARAIQRGDLYAAADQFPAWNRANGKVNDGLVTRRAAERKVFLSGIPKAA